MCATADDAPHAIAACEAADVCANVYDFAGVLQTRDVGWRSGWRGIAAFALVNVGAVEA